MKMKTLSKLAALAVLTWATTAQAGKTYDLQVDLTSGTLRVGAPGANRNDAVFTSSGAAVVQSTSATAAHQPLRVKNNAGVNLLTISQDGKSTYGDGSALSNRLNQVEIGTGRVQIGTTVAHAVRNDTFLEVQGENPGIGIYNTTIPADGTGEAFLEMGAYDSSGVWRDQGGLGTQWVSSNTADGYASYVMDVGYMDGGVLQDDAFVTAYANRGVRFFGPDRKSPPGFQILQVDGPFYSTEYHAPSTGTGITVSYSDGDQGYIVSRNWLTGAEQGLTISLSTLTISNASGAPMTILNNGMVGINNTAPLAKLDVGGHMRTTSYAAPATGSGLEFGFTAGEGYIIPWNRTANVAQGLLIYGSTITLHTQNKASAVTLLNSGNVGIGLTTPAAVLHVVGGGTVGNGRNEVLISSPTAGPAVVDLYRSDTSIASGNALGWIDASGSDNAGTTRTTHARIEMRAALDHASGDNPMEILFHTTPDGSATMAERMRIGEIGQITISTFTGTYGSGSAHVCVTNAGLLFVSEAACP